MKTLIKKQPTYEVAGSDVTLICQCNGSVDMEWFKNGHKISLMISSTISSGRLNITRNIMKIKNFKKTDEGKYECRVNYKKYNWTDFDNVNLRMNGKEKNKFSLTDKHKTSLLNHLNH